MAITPSQTTEDAPMSNIKQTITTATEHRGMFSILISAIKKALVAVEATASTAATVAITVESSVVGLHTYGMTALEAELAEFKTDNKPTSQANQAA